MGTILTLEDELEINDFYKDLLEDCQYKVMNSCDYTEAIDIIKRYSVDLVIVDNRLEYSHSIKNGLQTAMEIKALSPHTKIIMISANYPAELEDSYYQFGINALMRKPFDINELMTTIHQLIPAA
jgi:DNA-binding response OmpR family regulator